MKLLLTSAGVKNESIRQTLIELLGKPREPESAFDIGTKGAPAQNEIQKISRHYADIAASVQRAASGTSQVSQNITSVTTATTETGEVAQAVLQSSEQLAGKLQVLQREVSEFVSGLRAA